MTAAAGTARSNIAEVRVVYASFWRRFWALMLDVLFMIMLSGLVDLALPESANAVALLVWVLYPTLTTMGGGGVGKRILSLRVVRADGAPVGVVHAFVREVLVRPLSLLVLGIGTLWMLDSPRRQAWHDVAAGTVVVREIPMQVWPEWGDNPPWNTPGPRETRKERKERKRVEKAVGKQGGMADRLAAYEAKPGSTPKAQPEADTPDAADADPDDPDNFFTS